MSDDDGFTFAQISENTRIAYTGRHVDAKGRRIQFRPDKHALMSMIVICAQLRLPLPIWAAQMVTDIEFRWRTGKLKSWEDVFGKPFRGKTRKGALTRSRKLEVWIEVQRLHQQGRPIDESLFEEVGKKLKIGGKSTVSHLYYEMEDPVRKERLAQWKKVIDDVD